MTQIHWDSFAPNPCSRFFKAFGDRLGKWNCPVVCSEFSDIYMIDPTLIKPAVCMVCIMYALTSLLDSLNSESDNSGYLRDK